MRVLVQRGGGAAAGTTITLTDTNHEAVSNFASNLSRIQSATARPAPGPRVTAATSSASSRKPAVPFRRG